MSTPGNARERKRRLLVFLVIPEWDVVPLPPSLSLAPSFGQYHQCPFSLHSFLPSLCVPWVILGLLTRQSGSNWESCVSVCISEVNLIPVSDKYCSSLFGPTCTACCHLPIPPLEGKEVSSVRMSVNPETQSFYLGTPS